MTRFRPRRPSAATLIATVALFVALGGTGYAAFNLPKGSVGTKQLKNNAVTSSKIKNGAVTASKINASGLAVPNASHAGSADNATNAGNATTAGNAAALGGVPASGYTRNDCSSFTGQIKGWAIIQGSSSFSTTFVPVLGYNCASGFGSTGQVMAKRNGVGLYEVEFPNNPDTVVLGSATPFGFIDETNIGAGHFVIGVQNETGTKIDETFNVLSP